MTTEQLKPGTKLVEVRLSALTRVEYMEVVEVPANITKDELDQLVDGLSGAKRLAVKRSSRVTFTARVAIRNATGEFETVASLNNSKAITRRRAMWFTHSLQG